jgi:quinol monooxygenase YgiN
MRRADLSYRRGIVSTSGGRRVRPTRGGAVAYGYFGSMKTRPGHRDEIVDLLVGGAGNLRAAGCLLYAVGVSDTQDDTILVSEIWESREHHDRSLQLPEVKAAIGRAMPVLTGEFTRQEMTVVGGLGV